LNNDLDLFDVTLVIVIGTTITLLLCCFVVMFFFSYKKRSSDHLLEVQRMKEEFTRTLLQTQLEIKEQTLNHIGYELHDNLGQLASLIKINLTTIDFTDSTKIREDVENTKDLVRTLIGDLKNLSLSLNGDHITKLGMGRALELEIRRLNRTGQFEAVLNLCEPLPHINPSNTIIIYRMIQEILNNAIKHSQAKHISVDFFVQENMINLVCCDDGVGFDPDKAVQAESSGLSNLRHRAQLLNARFTIQSALGKGTTTTLQLPL
jgi:signal transduction histidine kinase